MEKIRGIIDKTKVCFDVTPHFHCWQFGEKSSGLSPTHLHTYLTTTFQILPTGPLENSSWGSKPEIEGGQWGLEMVLLSIFWRSVTYKYSESFRQIDLAKVPEIWMRNNVSLALHIDKTREGWLIAYDIHMAAIPNMWFWDFDIAGPNWDVLSV